MGRRLPRPTRSSSGKSCRTPGAAKDKLKLLFLSCGNKDGLMRVSQGLHAYLKENHVPHTWHVDGNGHDPKHWKNTLYHFLQQVLR